MEALQPGEQTVRTAAADAAVVVAKEDSSLPSLFRLESLVQPQEYRHPYASCCLLHKHMGWRLQMGLIEPLHGNQRRELQQLEVA